MDKSSSTILALTIGVVLIAIAAAGVALAADGNDSENSTGNVESDQHWYEVWYSGYTDKNGTATYYGADTGPANMTNYDVAIYTLSNGAFSGSFNGDQITGTVDDGTIRFYSFINDNQKTYFTGYIDGKMMYGVNTDIMTDGSQKINAYYVVYSTDPAAAFTMPEFADMTGRWSIQSATSLGTDGTGTPLGTDMTITAMNGPAFAGNMQCEDDGKLVEVTFVGALTGQTVGGYQLGLAIDANGDNWHVLMNDSSVIMQTGYFGEDPVAVERFYTDGSEVDEDVFDIPDLTGRSWTLTDGYSSYSSGTVQRVFEEMTVTVTAQHGSLITGTINGCLPFSGYLYDSDKLVFVLSGHSFTSSDVYCDFGTISGDELHLTDVVSTFADSGLTYRNSFLTLSSAVTFPEDLTGQWSCVYSKYFGHDIESTQPLVGGTYNLLSDDQSELTAYSLQICSQQNDTMQLYIFGQSVVAACHGHSFEFAAAVEDADGYACTVNFRGTVLNDHIIKSQEIYEYTDGSVIVCESYYSTVSVVADASSYLTDGLVELNIYNDLAYWYNGSEEGALSGDHLKMYVTSDILIAHIEEEVDDQVQTRVAVGFVNRQTATGFEGMLVDTGGNKYAVVMDSGAVYLYGNFISDTAKKDLVSMVRIYVQADQAPALPTFMLLDGTTLSNDEVTFHLADGSTAAAAVNLTFTQSEHGLLAGTATIDGKDCAFVGYSYGSVTVLKLAGNAGNILIASSNGALYAEILHAGADQAVAFTELVRENA